MRRTFGFDQQSYSVHQGAQHQSYSMHQEEAWHSNNEYHNSHISGVKIAPAAASVCFDSEFSKHNALFNGSHATNDGWLGQNMHQKQSNGWSGSGSGFGSGTSSTSYYNHSASGAGSSGKKYLPAITVLNASQFSNGGAMFNIASTQNAGGSYETIQEVIYVPAATMRVQEVRYERSSANWDGDENDGLQHCIMGTGMLSGFQRVEPKRRDFCHQIRRAWC